MITKLGKADNQFMMFGATGTMEQLERVHISRGTKIIAFGFAGARQNFVVYDDNMHAVEICTGDPDAVDKYDLDRYFSEFKTLDETTRPISKEYGIGFYYDESGEIISDEIIEKSLKRAENIGKLRKQLKEEKERKEAEARKNLPKQYPHLEVCKAFDHKTCGKNIRAELKKNFPTTKFSVRYESFSGGNSYDISWTDGPTKQAVENIVRKFQNMHPDEYSMGDYWDCNTSIFNELFGSVGYVMTSRIISDEAKEKVRVEYSDLNDENKGTFCFKDEDKEHVTYNMRSWSLSDILYHIACGRDFQEPEKKQEAIYVKTDGLQIVEYSEKAFAVIGNTKEYKDDLKKLGGRFNARLSCGAGWIFSNKQREAVEAII